MLFGESQEGRKEKRGEEGKLSEKVRTLLLGVWPDSRPNWQQKPRASVSESGKSEEVPTG